MDFFLGMVLGPLLEPFCGMGVPKNREPQMVGRFFFIGHPQLPAYYSNSLMQHWAKRGRHPHKGPPIYGNSHTVVAGNMPHGKCLYSEHSSQATLSQI